MLSRVSTAGSSRKEFWSYAAWWWSAAPDTPAEERDELLARYREHGGRICLLPVHSVDFSASEIRRRAAAGISFRYQVPEAVEEYIGERRLYRDFSTKEHEDARRDC